MRTAFSCSQNSPHFLELHYWARLGDGLISLSCPVLALSNNLVCTCPTQHQFYVFYPAEEGRSKSCEYSWKCMAAAGLHVQDGWYTSNTTTVTIGVMSPCSSVTSNNARFGAQFDFPSV